jgi:type IV secretory pathway VirB3-like protein
VPGVWPQRQPVYFGGIIDQAASVDPILAGLAIAASMLGTSLAAQVLEAMSDVQFRLWANRIITTIASYYIIEGAYLIFWRTA